MKKTTGMITLALVAILATESTIHAAAVNKQWTGAAASGNMSNNGNWAGGDGGSPIAKDWITFNSKFTAGNKQPIMNDSFLVAQIRAASSLTRNVNISGGNAANSLRVRSYNTGVDGSTKSVGIDWKAGKTLTIAPNGILWQDNQRYPNSGSTVVTENDIVWQLTGANSKVIVNPGTLRWDMTGSMRMHTADASNVFDIRTAAAANGGANIGCDVIKTGAGELILGAQNKWTGNTEVQGGTLKLSVDNAIHNSSDLVFQDGTSFLTQGNSDVLGTLEINGTVVFDLSGGDSTLVFDDSSGVAWGSTLQIINYDAGDSIQFGTDGSGLTSTQLADITINGAGGLSLDGSGYLIPEPATIGLIMLSSLGMLFFRRLAI
jgi:autotransporter-associated beta strand protein